MMKHLLGLFLLLLPMVGRAADCPWWQRICESPVIERGPAPEARQRRNPAVKIETICKDMHTTMRCDTYPWSPAPMCFEDSAESCPSGEICLSPSEIKIGNVVKWDEVEKQGKIYGYPGPKLTEADAQAVIAKLFPETACKKIELLNSSCEKQDTAVSGYLVVAEPTIDPTIQPQKYGIFHTQVCDPGTMCFNGQCLDPKNTIACTDSDAGGVGKNHPYLTPGKVTTPGVVFADECKTDQFLMEQYCENGQRKFKGVNCGDLGGKCESGFCKPVPGQKFPDQDKDDIADLIDNCPKKNNLNQSDEDGDGVGDICDNCPYLANSDQLDSDKDEVGNACDNCPKVANKDQWDLDKNGVGNACACVDINFVFADPELTPEELNKCKAYICEGPTACSLPIWWVPGNIGVKDSGGTQLDGDGDSIPDSIEECVTHSNPKKIDSDEDGLTDGQELAWQSKSIRAFNGNVHPAHLETVPIHKDTDGDKILDGNDLCPLNPNPNCNPAACIKSNPPGDECTAQLVYSSPFLAKYDAGKEGEEKFPRLVRVAWAAGSPNIVAISESYPIGKKPTGVDYAVQILQSSDGGKTWVTATVTNPGTQLDWSSRPISLSADGKERRLSTDLGLYESHDFGKTWVNGYQGLYKDNELPNMNAISTRMQWVSPDGKVEYAVGKKGALSKRTPPNGQWEWIIDPSVPYCINGICKKLPTIDVVVGDLTGSKLLLGAPEKFSITISPNTGLKLWWLSMGPLAMSLGGDKAFEIDKLLNNSYAVLTQNDQSWSYSTQSDQILLDSPFSINSSMSIHPNGQRVYVMNGADVLWVSEDVPGEDKMGYKWTPVHGDFGAEFYDIAVSPDGKEVMAVGVEINGTAPDKNVIYKFTCP